MSPLIGSFPAGVVTGDVGILTVSYDEKCGCGRYGPTIEFKRRASDEDIPGCAPRQERLLKGIEERRE